MTLIIVDCEAPFGKGAPSVADMTELGAICYDCQGNTDMVGKADWFHGADCSQQTFGAFGLWLNQHSHSGSRPICVSDNPAFDWQWVNYYFWKYFHSNPFGHSARRIGDYYAGLMADFREQSSWKNLRVTPHTHNPVDDARGNCEAFRRILSGERARRRGKSQDSSSRLRPPQGEDGVVRRE